MTWKSGVAAGYIDFLDQLQALLCNTGHAFGKTYAGSGNGDLVGANGVAGGYVGGAASVAETFTITATSATEFSVVGSLAGNVGTATVGAPFVHARVAFTITAGSAAYQVGDQYKLSTSPAWEKMRRTGAIASALFSSFANGSRLWDNFTNSSDTDTAATSPLPATFGMQMIAADVVRRVSMTVGNIYQGEQGGPSTFYLEYSDDGAAWSVAGSFTGVVWAVSGEGRTFVFPAAGAHVYWRVRITALTAGTTTFLREVRFFRDTTGDVVQDGRGEVVFRAPGNDGLDNIYIGLEAYEDVAIAARSFNFYQFRAFDPLVRVRNQAASSGLRNVPLTSNNFTYWIAVNGRRFVGVAKIGAVYVPFYQGLGKPYELPSVHPYPAINAGTSSQENGVATSTSPDFRGFSSPGRYGLVARYPDNAWRPHANRYSIGSTSDQPDGQTPGKVYPAAFHEQGYELDMRENLDGTRALYEIVLLSSNPRHAWGELDGCYFTPGFNLIPEQVITMDGFTHTVFQNCFRNAAADFFALRQD